MNSVIYYSLGLISLIFVIGLGLTGGCEEVLEVCAPCASVEDGDVNVAGDPRIDTTIDGVQAIRQFALQAEAAFHRDLQLLSTAFEVDPEAGMDVLTQAIRKALWVDQVVETAIIRQRARCWVDMELADRAELSCETKLSCNLPLSAGTGERRPDCIGWFVGQCDGSCEGTCYGDSTSSSNCGTQCVGTCVNDGPVFCPGKCYGVCSEACDSYSEDGECAGHCPGQCAGICASTSGFPCSGSCYGRCASDADGGVCDDGECHGKCTQTNGGDAPPGLCRGNVVYREYDPNCGDCAEAAEALAWSRINCEPALVEVAIRFLPGALLQEVDKTALVHKATVLELALSRMATDLAKLSLLLDGEDDAGKMTAESLIPTYTKENPMPEFLEKAEDYGVVQERKYLPLDKLKARVGWMTEFATSGTFKLAAGVLPCVTPALESARAILEQMVPVIETSGGSGNGFDVDRTCSRAKASHLAPCLFSLRDDQLTLINISDMSEE